jgi:hypothetical protein
MSADFIRTVVAPLDAPRKPSRWERQRAIEDAIRDFHPTWEESQDILDAVSAVIEQRYEDKARDCLFLMKKLRAELETLAPAYEEDAVDLLRALRE